MESDITFSFEVRRTFKKLTAAYEETESDLPWVVYQVVGMLSPTFFALVPMRTLAQNDDLLMLWVHWQVQDRFCGGAFSL
jgi:hypothetical protein